MCFMDPKETWEEVMNNDIWGSAQKNTPQAFVRRKGKEFTCEHSFLSQVHPKGQTKLEMVWELQLHPPGTHPMSRVVSHRGCQSLRGATFTPPTASPPQRLF